MTNCGAPGCTNRSANNKNISFYRLSSKNKEIEKKRLLNLNRKFIPETLSVCSKHFKPSYFKRDLQAELLGTKPRNILKDDAFPTIFKHSQGPSRKRSPQKSNVHTGLLGHYER